MNKMENKKITNSDGENKILRLFCASHRHLPPLKDSKVSYSAGGRLLFYYE
jgi:hypothetical protein